MYLNQTAIKQLDLKKIPALFLVTALFLFGTQAVRAEPTDVTLLQILADPVQHNLKIVRVVGFLHLEKDGNAIYLHEEDYKHALTGYSLAVEATDDMLNRIHDINDRYVILEGVYDAFDRGFMNAHTGTLRRISRCDEWSSNIAPANRLLPDGRSDSNSSPK